MERRRVVSAGVKRLNETALVSGTAHAESHAKLNNRIQSAPVVRQTGPRIKSTSSTTIQILDTSPSPKSAKYQREKENKENVDNTSVNCAKSSDVRRKKTVSVKENPEKVQRISSSTKFTFPTPVNYSTPVSLYLHMYCNKWSSNHVTDVLPARR